MDEVVGGDIACAEVVGGYDIALPRRRRRVRPRLDEPRALEATYMLFVFASPIGLWSKLDATRLRRFGMADDRLALMREAVAVVRTSGGEATPLFVGAAEGKLCFEHIRQRAVIRSSCQHMMFECSH